MSRPRKEAGGGLATKAVMLRRPRRWAREWRFRRSLAGPKVVHAFASAYPEASFVEVGSNDGEQHDPLRKYIRAGGWRGVMVEPVPYVFERLRRNYGGLKRVALERAAITDQNGRRAFYHLAEAEERELAELPRWYDGIGSFSREAVAGHVRHIGDIERRIRETQVPCLTFDTLCRKHGVERIDLLLIDTEGHDWQIIQSIDFDRRRPRLVIYEHFHLSYVHRAECRAHMERLGYETMEEGFDTFCLAPGAKDELTTVWRQVRPAVPGLSALDS